LRHSPAASFRILQGKNPELAQGRLLRGDGGGTAITVLFQDV
jgi:hypothetical protein